MKLNFKALITVLYCIIALYSVKADLPVHCKKSQIIGEWTIRTTPMSIKTRQELYEHKCGHQLPSHESSAYKSIFPKKSYTKSFKLTLSKSDQATIKLGQKKKTGKWTMVYDEGFDITIGNQSYFAFSMYSPGAGEKQSGVPGGKKPWNSKCYATLNGWYRIGDYWGCFVATKNNVGNPYKVTNGEAANKNIVVEGVIKPQNDIRAEANKELEEEEKEFKRIDKLIVQAEKTGKETHEKANDEMRYPNFVETNTKISNKVANKSKLQLNTTFKSHASVVDRLNSMGLSWKAFNYEKFSSMTLEQMNKFSGRNKKKAELLYGFGKGEKVNVDGLSFSENRSKKHKKFKKSKLKKSKKPKKRSGSALQAVRHPISEADPDYKDLPREHLKWKQYVNHVYSQGNCGSCYILSTFAMIKARLEIKYGIKEDLSIDHILNCSITNQGCDGGYSYLVSKFGADFELLPKTCEAARINGKFQCKKDCAGDEKRQKRSIKIKNYKFVGGSYGKSSEETMMKDIMENGPTVCSFSPGYFFNLYKEGVYNEISNKTWKMLGLTKPEWVKVEHSVLCIGWGIDEKTKLKYWLVLNSWGQQWGDKGFFKIRRGIDLEGIESIGESAIPYIEESE